MNTIILDNGLKIFYKKLLGTHSISLDLFVKAGVCYEDKNESGISNLLGNLHYRGICGYDQKQLFRKMESIGTSIQIYTYKDFIRFSMKIHPNFFKDSINIFRCIFQTYDWDELSLEKEKNTLFKQIEEEERYVDINKISSNNIHNESPLALPIKGYYSTINKLTTEQISIFKKKCFNQESTAFYFSGPIKDEHVEYVRKILGDIAFVKQTYSPRNIIPQNFCKRKKNLFWQFFDWDYIDVDISFDVSINETDYFNLDILNCILGEGVGSKLQTSLRENNSLVFDIRSFLEKYNTFNVLHIQYSIDKSNFLLSFKKILDILIEMKKNINESEIDTSLPFYRENLEFLLDEPQKYNFYYAYNSFILEHNDTDINSIVTPNDIMSLSRHIFTKDNVVVTCLGNDSKIEKARLKAMLLELG